MRPRIKIDEDSFVQFKEDYQSEMNSSWSANIKDAVTGRQFGELILPPDDEISLGIFNIVRTKLHQQEHSPGGDGDDIFRLMVNKSEVSSYLMAGSADESTYIEAISSEWGKWELAIFKKISNCIVRGTFKFVGRELVKGDVTTSRWALKKNISLTWNRKNTRLE